MRVARRLFLAIAVAAIVALPLGLRGADFPASLSDTEFWALTESLSEPNGFFRSDNFLSNERGYQQIIPDLLERIRPGTGVYLGVGPEQNFPYIDALRPRAAFIIDVRRGNLHEQLLYKALFELSATRADFVSRLFSRKRPDGLGAGATAAELFNAFDQVPGSQALYEQNLREVLGWLRIHHRFPLSDEDAQGIAYVYHDAFFINGPNLDYSAGRTTGFGSNAPTYRELMLGNDGTGMNRGFLATEDNFAFLKSLESRNLLVPVVGNFGGPKAIRAVGQYIREHGGTVVAFYLSNVEQYLTQDDTWTNFCANVATLPLDDNATFIYSGRGGPTPLTRGLPTRFPGGGGLQTTIRPIKRDLVLCQ